MAAWTIQALVVIAYVTAMAFAGDNDNILIVVYFVSESNYDESSVPIYLWYPVYNSPL